MNLLNLPPEVLRTITDEIEAKSDMLSFMLANTLCHASALRRHLRDVKLTSGAHVLSFCVLLDAHPDYQRHVHSLSLQGPPRLGTHATGQGWLPHFDVPLGRPAPQSAEETQLVQSVVEQVPQLIQKLCNLRSLTIEFAECAMRAYPALADAIARCTTLTTLALRAVFVRHSLHTHALWLVRALHAPLRDLTLEGMRIDPAGEPFVRAPRCAATVEKLKITTTAQFVPRHCWPRVHTLLVNGAVDAHAVSGAFPALKELAVYASNSADALPHAGVPQSKPWSAVAKGQIGHIREDIVGIGQLNMAGGPVDKLYYCSPVKNDWGIASVCETIERVRPRQLGIWTNDFRTLRFAGGLDCLTILELALSVKEEHPETIIDYLHALPPLFASLKAIKLLGIQMMREDNMKLLKYNKDGLDHSFCLADRSAYRTLLTSLAAHCPTLCLARVLWTEAGWTKDWFSACQVTQISSGAEDAIVTEFCKLSELKKYISVMLDLQRIPEISIKDVEMLKMPVISRADCPVVLRDDYMTPHVT